MLPARSSSTSIQQLAFFSSLTIGAAAIGAAGCGLTGGDAVGEDDAATSTTNGLSMINGLSTINGLTGTNGLASSNGLSMINGLSTINGLASSNGLMTTVTGRAVVSYIARCALAANDSLTKTDQNNVSYTFAGGLGLCPQWKNGSVQTDAACQELMSACLMAHVNTAGIQIPIWLDAATPQIGWGIDTVNYPFQEGTFFGNMMMTGSLAIAGQPNVSGPAAYYCDGEGFAQGAAGIVAGRLGAGQSGAPYLNPFGDGVLCKNTSGAVAQYSLGAGAQPAPDGFKTLKTTGASWNNPITVWRNANYTPKFNALTSHRLSPLTAPAKSIEVYAGSTTNGTAVQQFTTWDGDSQKFKILASGSNWKLVMKLNSNKCVGPRLNQTTAGTWLEVQDCNGSNTQAWTVTPDVQTGAFKFKNVAANRCLDVTGASTAEAARMQLYDCIASLPSQKFKIQAY